MARRPRALGSRRTSKNAKLELLGNVPLFSGCSKRDLARIASLADEIDVPKGKVLTRQGELRGLAERLREAERPRPEH